ncbi:MAG: hypothetical protein FWF53_07145 [Candidatus Azobacteroides sp.]|nr:hypothetical protein [Candidatus Azobacteroides sp.]
METLEKAKKIAQKKEIEEMAELLIKLKEYNTPTITEKLRTRLFGKEAIDDYSFYELNFRRENAKTRKLHIKVLCDHIVDALIMYYSSKIDEYELTDKIN